MQQFNMHPAYRNSQVMVEKVWGTEMGAMQTANGHYQIDCQIQHGQGTPLASARKTGVALANDVGSPLQNFHLTCSLDSSLNPPTNLQNSPQTSALTRP